VTDPESVGSLGEEAVRLLRAFAESSSSGRPDADGEQPGAAHVCTTAWCPVCQVVGFVKEHPEVVEQVADSAIQMVRSVRDVLLDQASSGQGDADPTSPA
jgi:hypothetical protein